MFEKATKKKAKLRLAIDGPSGSGKTWTALLLASKLGSKIAVVDTEHGSASLYSDHYSFDVVNLKDYHPQKYIDAIRAAEAAGYDVVILDSITHAWSGEGGLLDIVDAEATRSPSKNTYAAWRKGTPIQNAFIDAMLASPCHVIATMRTKMDYVQEKDDRGKTVIRKLGMAPIQREGMEYEFTAVADMDMEHNLIVGKTRCSKIDGQVYRKGDTHQMAEILKAWLNDGAEVATTPVPHPATPPPPVPPKSLVDEVDESRLASITRLFALCKGNGWTAVECDSWLLENFEIDRAGIKKVTCAVADKIIKGLENKLADLKAKLQEGK